MKMAANVALVGLSYFLWGVLPVFWALLSDLPVMVVALHRIFWAALTLLLIFVISLRRKATKPPVNAKNFLAPVFLASLMLGINWYVFLWAVSHKQLLQVSLGYFITPLANVALGVIVFQEKLRTAARCSIGFAIAGIFLLTLQLQSPPIVAILLSCSFATYAFLRKTAALKPHIALLFELSLLALPVTAFMTASGLFLQYSFQYTLSQQILLALAGPVTVAPLLLYARAVPELPLSMTGLLQYIAPSLQFVVALFIFQEQFSGLYLASFMLIWAGLIVYTTDVLFTLRRKNLQLRFA